MHCLLHGVCHCSPSAGSCILASSGLSGLPVWSSLPVRYPPSLCDRKPCGPILVIFVTQTCFASPLAQSEQFDMLSAVFCPVQWCPLTTIVLYDLFCQLLC